MRDLNFGLSDLIFEAQSDIKCVKVYRIVKMEQNSGQRAEGAHICSVNKRVYLPFEVLRS